jgi:hypothetical protein
MAIGKDGKDDVRGPTVYAALELSKKWCWCLEPDPRQREGPRFYGFGP